jgi:phage tail sheath protein FI
MAVQNFGSGGGFQTSPGINVSEIDLTTTTPAVDTTVGAFAGVFRWGPVGVRTLVTSENDLVAKFGKPTSINPETFFTAANFLSYSNALYISRAANSSLTTSGIAIAANSSGQTPTVGANSAYTILNEFDFATKQAAINASEVTYVARWPGALGNSLKVSVCDSPTQYSTNVAAVDANFTTANTKFTLDVGSTDGVLNLYNPSMTNFTGNTPLAAATTVSNKFSIGDFIVVGDNTIGTQALKILGKTVAVSTNNSINTGSASITFKFDQPLKLSTAIDTQFMTRYWEYYTQVDAAPSRSTFVATNGDIAAQTANTLAQLDELHVVVVDEDGGFTGSPGAVLEVFSGVSRATDSKLSDGTSNFYKNVINDRSNYIWAGADRAGAASNTAFNVATTNAVAVPVPLSLSFVNGADKDETEDATTGVRFADLARAYDLFNTPEDADISLILTGKARGGANKEQLANYVIDNVAEVRKDCVAFVSPDYNDVVNNTLAAADDVVAFRNAVRSTSFAVMDSGYKYQYDKYNDVYRYVPLNGDIAGLCVRTDSTNDPWYSPAGTTRGQVKNSVRLAFNPNKAQRDLLYRNGVNPVISQQGQGTFLNGDKTLLAKPSAFDRINVRRLFIVLEKTIANAAQSSMFEFNDEFTRAQFRNLVEPFLRDVQGRRGIYDFKVVCDATNNTSQVIDSNRFVGDIYVKPARSINYIQLNFVAVRSGIEFSEIVG